MASSHPSVATVPANSPVAEIPLRRRVLNGVRWEAGGQIGMHAWRFAGNLILTRLLAPEAFGILGLAQVFVMFLMLVSDVGLKGSVIHHPRGDERRFLDTVWTVGVIRGFVLWAIVCLGAAPFARFYGMPELSWVLPLIGFSAVIRGFSSTSVLTANRHLHNSWYVKVDCGSQVIGTAATVCIAFLLPTVAALALGWIVTAIFYALLSYSRADVGWNHFCWDRDALKSLASFGRWAVASSGFTLAQQQGDRLALGKIVSSDQLGTYVIGANLAMFPMTLFWRINSGVAQPFYARIRDESPESVRRKTRRLRLGIVLTHVPLLALLVVLGQPIVDFVYESAYHQAGWFCSIAALAFLVRVSTDMGPIYPAYGDAKSHFKIMAVRTISLGLGMALGYLIGSRLGDATNGVLYGIVAAPLMAYPYQAWMYRRLNAWLPEVDLIGLSVAAILVGMQIVGVI